MVFKKALDGLKVVQEGLKRMVLGGNPKNGNELAEVIRIGTAEMREHLRNCRPEELKRPSTDLRSAVSRLYAPMQHPYSGLIEMGAPGATKELNALGDFTSVQFRLNNMIEAYEGPGAERVKTRYRVFLGEIAKAKVEEVPAIFDRFAADIAGAAEFFAATAARGLAK